MSEHEYLNRIAEQCLRDLTSMNIPYGNIRDFTVNRRSKMRWGQCRYMPDGFHININEALCDGKHEEGLKSTLIHEILHTCDGCMNHGNRWKHWAAIVHDNTGLNIQTGDTVQNKGFTEAEYLAKRRPPKYKLMCKKCGLAVSYRSKSKVVKNYTNYRCGSCGGELELITLAGGKS